MRLGDPPGRRRDGDPRPQRGARDPEGLATLRTHPLTPRPRRAGKGGREDFPALLRRALGLQQQRCALYRSLCRARRWSLPSSLASESSLARVPFLSTLAFKRAAGIYPRLVNTRPGRVAAWSASTGTGGELSLVGRSAEDLAEARRGFAEFGRRFGHLTRDLALLFFPSPADLRRAAGAEGGRPVEPLLAQLLEEFGAARERRFLLPGPAGPRAQEGARILRVAGEFGGALALACERNQSVFIGGAVPALALSLEGLQATGFRAMLPPGGLLMLAGGGWDGRQATLSAPMPIRKSAFMACAARVLGLRQRQVTDVYSFAETPAFFNGHFSQEEGDFLYHAPPWARVLLRDPATLEAISDPGRPGLVQVLTWRGVSSYPGAALLADDEAEWSARLSCPVCRHPGPLFKVMGRAAGAAARACAELASELCRL